MELVISIALGVWIMISGVVCLIFYKNDNVREGKK